MTADPMIGLTLGGRYRIEKLIGEGQMAQVYEAEQLTIARRIAIKTLRAELSGVDDAVGRFRREVEAVALLRSPHTIEFYDFGEVGNQVLFIAMELLTGETLRQRIKREEPMTAAEAVAILRQVAWSLDEAHWANVAHRDLKPENIYLCALPTPVSPFVKVLDFGFAKLFEADTGVALTGQRQVVGTPAYMAPETAVVERVADTRADIYALGVIGFELLGGTRPFHAATAVEMMIAHTRSPVPAITSVNSRLPAAADDVFRCVLAKDPEERYQTAAQFIAGLDAALPL